MQIKVFGCKTNLYFAQKWMSETELSKKDGVFVASCVVTDQAKHRWTKFVLRTLRSLPEGKSVYLTGCWALRNGTIDEKFFEAYPDLAPYKERIVLLPEEPPTTPISPEVSSSKLAERLQQARAKISGVDRTRKTVVIQTGCDNFCTFCLTVQARGRHKYRSSESIIQEINEYVSQGGKEVVLTGINLGAWGADTSLHHRDARLPELIDTILENTSIERLRISSLGAEFLTDELVQRFTKKRIIPYVHISIQSGSDAILTSMRRQYGRAELLARLQKIQSLVREDGVLPQIGADLIVGYPGEEESDFADTLSLVESHGVTQLHAFPFSAHMESYPVPAGKFPNQVPEDIKHERLRRLIAAGESAKHRFLTQNNGKRFELLLEGKTTGEQFSWLSQNYIELNEKNFTPDEGQQIERGKVIRGIFRLLSTETWV